WPMEVGTLSAPPVAMLWQVLQLSTWLRDRRGSNHSDLPSSTWAAVIACPRTWSIFCGTGANRALAVSRSAAASGLSAAWAGMASSPVQARARAAARVVLRRRMEVLRWGCAGVIHCRRMRGIDCDQPGPRGYAWRPVAKAKPPG